MRLRIRPWVGELCTVPGTDERRLTNDGALVVLTLWRTIDSERPKQAVRGSDHPIEADDGPRCMNPMKSKMALMAGICVLVFAV
jgi:hypothetical protein